MDSTTTRIYEGGWSWIRCFVVAKCSGVHIIISTKFVCGIYPGDDILMAWLNYFCDFCYVAIMLSCTGAIYVCLYFIISSGSFAASLKIGSGPTK
jgi:hypothetical protein